MAAFLHPLSDYNIDLAHAHAHRSYSLVLSVYLLLAPRTDGAGTVSNRLADSASLPDCILYSRSGVKARWCNPAFPISFIEGDLTNLVIALTCL